MKENTVEHEVLSYSFDDGEKISRSIFSPINLKKDATLRNNAFTTPPEKDEVSVNRLSHSTPDFIKKISQLISKPEDNRNYCGLAILLVREIYECKSEIVYSPMEIKTNLENIFNKFHSDIKIGYIKEKGNPLPAEFSYKIDKLIETARFYLDKNPNSDVWDSGDLL